MSRRNVGLPRRKKNGCRNAATVCVSKKFVATCVCGRLPQRARLRRKSPPIRRVRERRRSALQSCPNCSTSNRARIGRTMKRFADQRLRPNAHSTKDGFLPVLGAGSDVYISRTLVTNAQFGEFLKASGGKKAKVVGGANHPAVNVSYDDAVAFCKWMTQKDGGHTYRLPTETEWEFTAGHMPKDATSTAASATAQAPWTPTGRRFRLAGLSICGATAGSGLRPNFRRTAKSSTPSRAARSTRSGRTAAPSLRA